MARQRTRRETGKAIVAQGVLRECLLDPDVRVVQTVGRTATGLQLTKLRCFFCLSRLNPRMTFIYV